MTDKIKECLRHAEECRRLLRRHQYKPEDKKALEEMIAAWEAAAETRRQMLEADAKRLQIEARAYLQKVEIQNNVQPYEAPDRRGRNSDQSNRQGGVRGTFE